MNKQNAKQTAKQTDMRKVTFLFLSILVLVLGLYITRGGLTGNNPPVPEETDFAQELYELRNPYIGDASANSRILQALLSQELTGPYHMELETTVRPYVLRVIFEEMPENPEWLESFMQQNGLLMLALIDNADAVQFAYPLELGEEPVVSALRINREALYEALDVTEDDYDLTPAVLEQILTASY